MKLDKSKVLQRFRDYNPEHSSFFRCALEEYAETHNEPAWRQDRHHILGGKTIVQWYPHANVVWIGRDAVDDLVMALMRLFHRIYEVTAGHGD
jgi:hypothetical protein